MAAQIEIVTTAVPIASGTKTFGAIANLVAPVGQVTEVAFAGAVFAAVTIPAGATYALIVPPAGIAQTLTLKGVNGDTGIVMPAAVPALVPVSGASFGLTSSAAITGNVEVSFL